MFFAGLVLFLTFLARGREDDLAQADSLASVASAFLSIAALLVAVVALIRDGRGDAPPPLDRAAARLAELGVREWTAEIRSRRLRHPQPLRLTWHQSGGAEGFLVPDDPQPAAGLVAAFRALPTRHLAIRGAPGSGKSTLAVLFTVAAAYDRTATEPVPVLLPVAGWRPDAEELRPWLARWIATNYPELTDADRYGPDAPTRLVDENRVLLVLDGLDELDRALREQAAVQISDLAAAGGPEMLITCREKEYDELVAAIGQRMIPAELTIDPATVDNTIAFLTASEPEGSDRWAVVAAELRADPSGELARALSTPLMISLARSVHGPDGLDPDHLTWFDWADEIEEHLVSAFLDDTYPHDHRSQRHLRTIAQHLRHRLHSPNLAWWELPLAIPSPILVVIITSWVTTAVGLAFALLRPLPEGGWGNLRAGLFVGLLAGLVAGLNAARNLHRRSDRRWVAASVAGAAARGATVVAVALAFLAFGLGFDDAIPDYRWTRSTDVDAGVLFAGAGAGVGLLTSGLAVWRGTVPIRPAWHFRRLPVHLLSGLVTGLLFALPVGAITAVAVGLDRYYSVESDADDAGRVLHVSDVVWLGGARSAAWSVVLLAVGIGLPVGIGRWLSSPPDDQEAASPRVTFRADWTTSLAIAVSAGLSVGVSAAYLSSLDPEQLDVTGYPTDASPAAGLAVGVIVLVVVLLGSGAPWVSFTAARLWLAGWRRLPWRTLDFLEAARARGVLRQVGPLLQFRHDKVERHLAGRVVADDVPTPESRQFATVTDLRRRQASRKIWSVLTTMGSVVAVGYLVVAGAVAELDDSFSYRLDDERDGRARALTHRADAISASHPQAALQLRIAAAEIDPDGSSVVELGAYLQAGHANAKGYLTHQNYLVAVGTWLVLIRTDGEAEAWDLSAAAPTRYHLADGVYRHVGGNDDGDYLALEGEGAPTLWDLSGEVPRSVALPVPGTEVEVLDLSARHLALSDRSELTFWDLDDLRSPLARLDGSWADAVDLDDDSDWALAARTGMPRLAVDLAHGGRIVKAGVQSGATYDLLSDFAGATLMVHDDGSRFYWDLDSTPPQQILEVSGTGDDPVRTSDGRWMLYENSLFDLRGPRPVRVDVGLGDAELQIDDAGLITAIGGDRSLWALDIAGSGPPVATRLATGVSAYEISVDGRTAVVKGTDESITFVGLPGSSTGTIAAGHSAAEPYQILNGPWAVVPHRDESTEVWDLRAEPRRRAAFTPAIRADDSSLSPAPDATAPWILAKDTQGREYLWNLAVAPTAPVPLPPRPANTYTSRWSDYAIRSGDHRPVTAWHLGPEAATPQEMSLGSVVDDVTYSTNGAWGLFTYDRFGSERLETDLVSVWPIADLPTSPPPADPIGVACAEAGEPLSPAQWTEYAGHLEYHETCRGRS
ncbi:NACHT domain-containing protein [Actinoplanes bogorensis]|uniref:NACHT domain-containing protein n=1 Tax=Paractinoplanes bogorensis TaxID=1610840 RepID=A0ABS5YZX5_9ACTN|nr:NACHT domain-containing protein [Actinoplanes bogorensis]MBU2669005.1 NACHT domain-containing protein [Actinoplanes bogorensis]